MALPDSRRLMHAIDVTWPPAEIVARDGWVLRRGAGGGKRVSAASGDGEIGVATAAMTHWGQEPLFRLTPEDAALDRLLDASGYARIDPVILYAGAVSDLGGTAPHTAAAYRCQGRIAVMEEIWATGGIGRDRLAIMDRVAVPACLLLSRAHDTPAGVASVAIDADVAMIHAIEVAPALRRQGAGRLLIEAAARFADAHGATWLALAVTEANGPARALYASMGLQEAGAYHYRLAKGTT